MKFDTVIIKQIPDDYASYTGLHKYGRSKMPQTFEHFQPSIGRDNRYITGFDEESIAIKMINDPEKQARKYAELKELRENLQKQTGVADLSGTSPFWENYRVKISSDTNTILNWSNPMDIVAYYVLVSNRFAAPDREIAAYPEYRQCKYFCFSTERADKEEVSSRKIKDKAKSELVRISENHDLMVLIGQYLEGDKYKAKMSDNTIYKMLSEFIENPKEPENVKRFIKATTTGDSELQFKVVVDRAIKKRLIKYRDGLYQRGQVTLGKNPAEVLSNLKKPEFATEFLSLKDEIEG